MLEYFGWNVETVADFSQVPGTRVLEWVNAFRFWSPVDSHEFDFACVSCEAQHSTRDGPESDKTLLFPELYT